MLSSWIRTGFEGSGAWCLLNFGERFILSLMRNEANMWTVVAGLLFIGASLIIDPAGFPRAFASGLRNFEMMRRYPQMRRHRRLEWRGPSPPSDSPDAGCDRMLRLAGAGLVLLAFAIVLASSY
jgi:hypothetical protein